MDKAEKIEFICEWMGTALKEVIEKINDDEVPKHWDRAELQRYILRKLERRLWYVPPQRINRMTKDIKFFYL